MQGYNVNLRQHAHNTSSEANVLLINKRVIRFGVRLSCRLNCCHQATFFFPYSRSPPVWCIILCCNQYFNVVAKDVVFTKHNGTFYYIFTFKQLMW